MLVNLLQHRSLVLELIKREFLGRYQGSFGGIFWSFIQPLFLLVVYTMAFGVILQNRWGGADSATDYVLILFSGLIVFNLFLELLTIVTVSKAIIQALIAIAVWLVGFTLIVGVLNATVLLFPVILVCLLPVLLGINWILSAVGVVVRDVSQLTGMLNHILLFLVPIFYSVDIASQSIQHLLLLNPLTFFVEQFRKVLFYGQMSSIMGLALYFIFADLV